jgi:hypothetical protein
MAANLMIAVMLAAVMDLLESGDRRDQEREILGRAERQLRLVALGMAVWRSTP